jgi:hypothetical protein
VTDAHPRRRRFAATCTALALAAMAIIVAGCGNAKHDFRDHKLNPLVAQLTAQRSTLATGLRIARPHRAQDARALRAQLGAIGVTMRKIAALKPPSGTRVQFSRYVQANAALLSSLNQFVAAFAQGTSAQQQAAGQAAQAAISRASDARATLQHALS